VAVVVSIPPTTNTTMGSPSIVTNAVDTMRARIGVRRLCSVRFVFVYN
jgi:hypothetical protein